MSANANANANANDVVELPVQFVQQTVAQSQVPESGQIKPAMAKKRPGKKRGDEDVQELSAQEGGGEDVAVAAESETVLLADASGATGVSTAENTKAADTGVGASSGAAELSPFAKMAVWGGGGLGALLVGSGGSGGSGAAPAPAPAPAPAEAEAAPVAGNIVSGVVMLGPITGGLSVKAYKADGTEAGSSVVDVDGNFSIDVGSYTGTVLVQLVDDNAMAGNYRDESTGADKQLEVALRAVTVLQGSSVTVNLTPLTELSVRKMSVGLAAAGTTDLTGVSATDIQNANQATAKLFLGDAGTDITAQTPKPVIDKTGAPTTDYNTYGTVLAALSGVDGSAVLAGGLGMEATLDYLAQRITDTSAGSSATWLQQGAVAAGEVRTLVQDGLTESDGNNAAFTITGADLTALQAAGVIPDTVAPVIGTTTLVAAENGTAAGTLSGVDASGIIWALEAGGADNALFGLNSAGELTFLAAPNFEAPGSAATSNAYTIRVKATDLDGNAATQDITVNVSNVNEAPTVGTPIADQTVVVGQAFSYGVPGNSFADPDAGTMLSYSATLVDGSALPAWLVFNAGTFTAANVPALASPVAVRVTATDGALTVFDDFTFTAVSAPVLSSAVLGVQNLDVRSNIVITVTEDFNLSGTGTITLTGTTAPGFKGESLAHTQVLDMSIPADAARVTIDHVNRTLTINPEFDLDLSSDYTLDISTGLVTGISSGEPSLAFNTISFSTVTPGLGFAAAVESQSMDSATGGLVTSLKWFDASDLGSVSAGPGGQVAYDFSLGDYAATLAGSTWGATPALVGDTNIKLNNFGANDLVYFDNQDWTATAAQTNTNANAFAGEGTAGTPFAMSLGGTGTFGNNIIDIVLDAPSLALLPPDVVANPLLQNVISTGWSDTGMVIAA